MWTENVHSWITIIAENVIIDKHENISVTFQKVFRYMFLHVYEYVWGVTIYNLRCSCYLPMPLYPLYCHILVQGNGFKKKKRMGPRVPLVEQKLLFLPRAPGSLPFLLVFVLLFFIYFIFCCCLFLFFYSYCSIFSHLCSVL